MFKLLLNQEWLKKEWLNVTIRPPKPHNGNFIKKNKSEILSTESFPYNTCNTSKKFILLIIFFNRVHICSYNLFLMICFVFLFSRNSFQLQEIKLEYGINIL